MPRIIYSLVFNLENPGKGVIQLVVPLNRDGQAAVCLACSPKQRVIDMRCGDTLYHSPTRQLYRIEAVAAYRDNFIRSLPAG